MSRCIVYQAIQHFVCYFAGVVIVCYENDS